MKAVAVFAGGGGVHLIDVPRPTLSDGHGCGDVLVKVLSVGVDGTDKEILSGRYGAPPAGQDYLITGHENFGVVAEVGPGVSAFSPGDFVVATVRRAGSSIYDVIGSPDFTTDDTYFERGINLRHGYLAEYYLEEAVNLIGVPSGLGDLGVLLEPASVVEKGIAQAYEIQRRMRIWRPRKAAVLGAGTVGLLATLALRLRGFAVDTFAERPPPNLNAELVERIGANYHCVSDEPFDGSARKFGPYDLIFEATGFAPLAFEAMGELGRNGVLVLSSVTGGKREVVVDAARLNLEFVLGNKVAFGTVNASREHFELGVADFSRAELTWPGWLRRLLTHRIEGLDRFAELLELLESGRDVIKAYCAVSSMQGANA